MNRVSAPIIYIVNSCIPVDDYFEYGTSTIRFAKNAAIKVVVRFIHEH